jgi:hypothetical protein
MWLKVAENGRVETIFNGHEKPETDFIEYNGGIPVIEEQKGKSGYYFFNGTSLEVRYEDRPLFPEEELHQLQKRVEESENAILTLMDIQLMGGM